MKLKEVFQNKGKEQTKNDDVLRIDCRKCEQLSEYGNPTCLRCIIGKIESEPKKIVLDSGVEKEYAGDSVRLAIKLSKCFNKESTTKSQKCDKCSFSENKIMDTIWDSLTITNIDSMIFKLDNAVSDSEECQKCNIETKKKLEEKRNKLYQVSKEALASANKIVGV